MTTKVEKSVQVNVPVSTVYNQWTQFEDFPHFMGGVKEVRQLDDRRLHWIAEIAGVRREWEAAIVEQVADERISWAATSGATNAGSVRFAPTGDGATTVHLTLEYEPEGIVEQAGDKLGIVGRQAESDLEKFKSLIEDQGYASGAWRGEVGGSMPMGTPGVEDAAASQGDSGKAGISPTAVIAGAAAVAGIAAAAVKHRSGSDEGMPVESNVIIEPPVSPPAAADRVAAEPPPVAAFPVETGVSDDMGVGIGTGGVTDLTDDPDGDALPEAHVIDVTRTDSTTQRPVI